MKRLIAYASALLLCCGILSYPNVTPAQHGITVSADSHQQGDTNGTLVQWSYDEDTHSLSIVGEGITEIESLKGFDYVYTLELPKSVTAINDYLLYELNYLKNLDTIVAYDDVALTETHPMYIDLFNELHLDLLASFDLNISFKFNDMQLYMAHYGEASDTISCTINEYVFGESDDYLQKYAELKGITYVDASDTDTTTDVTPAVTEPTTTTEPPTQGVDGDVQDALLLKIVLLKKHILGITTGYDPTIDFDVNEQIYIRDLLLSIKRMLLL